MKRILLNLNWNWLSGSRLFFYSWVFVATYLFVFLGMCLVSKNGVFENGTAIGFDFMAFWAASYTYIHGNAADAFNMAKLLEAQRAGVPAVSASYFWLYPPTYQLLISPLAFLPYFISYATFICSTLALFVTTLRQFISYRHTTILIIAFPGTFINAMQGQNAFLTAAIAGLALLYLDRKPVVAGILIGLLCIKPHLAVLFPFALVASGRWRTLTAAAIAVISFHALSGAVLGLDVFREFLHNAPHTRAYLENGEVPWGIIPTVFVSLRLLGVPITAAYLIHFTVALGATFGVILIWKRRCSFCLRAASLFTGTFLVSPYLLTYDMAWLAFPIAWLVLYGNKVGWTHGGRGILALAWWLPLIATSSTAMLQFQIAPLLVMVLFAFILRQALGEQIFLEIDQSLSPKVAS